MTIDSKSLVGGLFMLGALMFQMLIVAVPPANPNIKLVAEVVSLNHPVSTQNPEAQRFFNQGLIYTYAFNHDAAYWSFQKAAELDPQLAMAYWGMALVLGPNINKSDALQDEHQAYELIQKALKLAPKATYSEKAYIDALAKRYTDSTSPDYQQLNQGYANAMKQLSQRYPDDLDAATLYAESLMDIHPWALWSTDGKPTEGTLEIVGLLEGVMKRDPDHLGANHYYIHAIEASPHPEYALMSAQRLSRLATEAGHLVHMPAHVYLRIGDYPAAIESNVKAVQADKEYIKAYGMLGSYPAHYMGHNLAMLAWAYNMAGQYNEAMKSAAELSKLYAPYHEAMPELEFRMDAPTLFVLLRFHRWHEILQLPKPDARLAVTAALWEGARGLAYVGLGNLVEAKQAQKSFQAESSKIAAEAVFGLNKAQSILKIMDDLLIARIAQAEHDDQKALEFLRLAAVEQDGLAYNEPADWFYPIRETLGAHLLQMQRYQEAEGAFRLSLEQNPRNGRALFGVLEAMRAQNRGDEAYWIQQEYNKAWRQADAPLTVNDL